MAGRSAKKAAHGGAQVAKQSSGFPMMNSMVNAIRRVKQTVFPTDRYNDNSFKHLKRGPGSPAGPKIKPKTQKKK